MGTIVRMNATSLSNEQLKCIIALEKAFQKCKVLNIGFFVQENDLLAFADRQELVKNISDHDYLHEYNWNVNHENTIIDCGAWA